MFVQRKHTISIDIRLIINISFHINTLDNITNRIIIKYRNIII